MTGFTNNLCTQPALTYNRINIRAGTWLCYLLVWGWQGLVLLGIYRFAYTINPSSDALVVPLQ